MKNRKLVRTVDKEKIGTGIAILVVTLIGLDFLDIPYNAARVGPSGYWSIWMAFGLAAILIGLISAMRRRFPSSNLLEVAPKVIGRIPALVGNLIFVGVFFIWLSFAVRDAADLVAIYLLNRTPLWFIMLVFLAGIGYVAIGGIKSVAYLAAFVLIPVFGFRVMMQLLAFQKIAWSHLMPIFSEPIGQYFIGGLRLFGYFSPVITFFLIHPQLEGKRPLHHVLLGGVGAAMLIYALSIVGTLGVFGSRYTQYLAWPSLTGINRINIPFLAMEQVGLLFLIVWLASFFVACAFYIYLIVQGLTFQFKSLRYPWTLIAVLVLVGGLGFLFPNMHWVHAWFTTLRIWAMVPWVLYPLIVFSIAVLRKVEG